LGSVRREISGVCWLWVELWCHLQFSTTLHQLGPSPALGQGGGVFPCISVFAEGLNRTQSYPCCSALELTGRGLLVFCVSLCLSISVCNLPAYPVVFPPLPSPFLPPPSLLPLPLSLPLPRPPSLFPPTLTSVFLCPMLQSPPPSHFPRLTCKTFSIL
jgi:hypothetical protein